MWRGRGLSINKDRMATCYCTLHSSASDGPVVPCSTQHLITDAWPGSDQLGQGMAFVSLDDVPAMLEVEEAIRGTKRRPNAFSTALRYHSERMAARNGATTMEGFIHQGTAQQGGRHLPKSFPCGTLRQGTSQTSHHLTERMLRTRGHFARGRSQPHSISTPLTTRKPVTAVDQEHYYCGRCSRYSE